MKQLERINLIDGIAYDLQEKMVTSQINSFLSGFGVQCEKVSIVPSKRVYVQELLGSISAETISSIAQELGLLKPEATLSKNLEKYLEQHGYIAAHEDFERAINVVETDPEQALGHASSILESICKEIIIRCNKEMPKDQSLKPLVKAAYNCLHLSPDSHADPDIKQILGGLNNVAAGIGVIRTKYSAFHGRSDSQKVYRLQSRHARLAIGSASVLGCFLIETYLDRKT